MINASAVLNTPFTMPFITRSLVIISCALHLLATIESYQLLIHGIALFTTSPSYSSLRGVSHVKSGSSLPKWP